MTRVLITGGAGFVGGSLARSFLRDGSEVVLFDNLRRRGSEWNLGELLRAGAKFVHGDVRVPADLDALEGNFDLLIEASAEPSVHAGIDGSPRYVIETNLGGAANCLEFARERCGGVVFLSTSRVYSIEALRALPLIERETRFDLQLGGITEDFSTRGSRSYYGASKLAAELLCEEYAAHGGVKVVVNRCGVIAGPGQFGRSDQGVFTLWVARHIFGRPLTYTGFGGTGKQVRDLLHPDDLYDLIARQLQSLDAVSGETFNVGGGRQGSVSMQELTALCREATGATVPVTPVDTTASVDVPWYITDHAKVTQRFGWTPRRDPESIVRDIATWIGSNRDTLRDLIV
ncbi:MAG TPA: NAD-dependent epimerase/dehydratase family protein [Thermoanaerobaculia bacterium]|nr:NAD-dependent epimerase/dehydratase family protein [Thermoanaerobaculia bacterium]